MAVALRTFGATLPPEPLWALFSDFNRWKDFFILDDPKKKGWGNRWRVKEGSGAGMVVEHLLDDKVVQVWEVEQWSPPTRLKLVSRKWNGAFYLSMKSSIDIAISTVSKQETSVDIQFAAAFSFPGLGSLLNQMVPLKKDLNAVLARMEMRLGGLLAAK